MRNLNPPAADIPLLLNQEADGAGWPLLIWMGEAGYLTNDLVALRYYRTPWGVRTASYRLSQLARWGLITRRPLRQLRQVWHLTEQGARLLAEHLCTTPRALGYDGREAYVHESRISHGLALTELQVALEIHGSRTGGLLSRFIREPLIQTEAGPLRPDAALVYTNSARTWNYTVELDRNTETPMYVAATKVPRYDGMARSGTWQLVWEQMPTCLVVVAAGGSARVRRLKAAIDAMPVSEGDYRLFKLVATEELCGLPPSYRGALPVVETRFEQSVCLVAMKPETERRAVLG